ncbi:MAG: hypothetical protein LBU14_03250 [Candidatus Peribacteria bacterium]|jgi:hypothetical protein|nr:hypothetical protein [Candidatus Peribacteria bacterium]
MLYFVNGALYLKENLIEKDDKIYLKENPFVITSANNKFVVNNFIEAPNSFVSYTAMSNMINVSFYSTPDVHNYRLSFYDIIDKSWNEKNYAYVPEFTKEHIVDAVA